MEKSKPMEMNAIAEISKNVQVMEYVLGILTNIREGKDIASENEEECYKNLGQCFMTVMKHDPDAIEQILKSIGNSSAEKLSSVCK